MPAAARDDLPAEGRGHAGGYSTVDGRSFRRVVDLRPGDRHVAASQQAGDDAAKTMRRRPLRRVAKPDCLERVRS